MLPIGIFSEGTAPVTTLHPPAFSLCTKVCWNLTPLGWLPSKTQEITTAGEDAEKLEPCAGWWEDKVVQLCEDTMAVLALPALSPWPGCRSPSSPGLTAQAHLWNPFQGECCPVLKSEERGIFHRTGRRAEPLLVRGDCRPTESSSGPAGAAAASPRGCGVTDEANPHQELQQQDGHVQGTGNCHEQRCPPLHWDSEPENMREQRPRHVCQGGRAACGCTICKVLSQLLSPLSLPQPQEALF